MATAAPTDHNLLLAFDGHELPGWLREVVAAGRTAGVTLFPHYNVDGPEQLRALTDAIQQARPDGAPPLLVAADQEGGQLVGLGPATTGFAGNLALGATGDPDLARRVGAAIGHEARALGVNLDYAPVCDLALTADNPTVGLRSFGDDPDRVGPLAAAFARGLADAGVAATAKHFPGLGSTSSDTHHQLAVAAADHDLLERRDLAPFRAAIAAGVPLVMTGHVAVPALTGRDDLPATLSRTVVTDVLRGRLGFDGVVVTDALDMHAVAQGAGRIVDAVAALAAGVDLLLCKPEREVNQAVAAGLAVAAARDLLDPAALAASRERVERLRTTFGTTEQLDLDVVGGAAHGNLAAELARRAITLVHDDAGVLPLAPPADAEVLVLEPRPRDHTPADTTSTLEPRLARELRRHLPRVTSVVYDDPPGEGEVAAVRDRAGAADLVVLGTSGAHVVPEQAALAAAVIGTGTPTVAVLMRTPHDVAVLAGAGAVLCAYGAQPASVAAAADVLAGVASAEGRLPVAVAGLGRTTGVAHSG